MTFDFSDQAIIEFDTEFLTSIARKLFTEMVRRGIPPEVSQRPGLAICRVDTFNVFHINTPSEKFPVQVCMTWNKDEPVGFWLGLEADKVPGEMAHVTN